MNREQKTALVDELSDQIRSAEAIFAVDYRGISVSDAADLRGRLREAQTRFRVVKNSLTERASDQAGAEALKPMLDGPTALAFVTGDAALAAKALNDAARVFGTLDFKGGLMNGAALTAEDAPEPEAEAAPEPEAEAAPEPEARAAPEPEAGAEAAPEPEAEAAPQAE